MVNALSVSLRGPDIDGSWPRSNFIRKRLFPGIYKVTVQPRMENQKTPTRLAYSKPPALIVSAKIKIPLDKENHHKKIFSDRQLTNTDPYDQRLIDSDSDNQKRPTIFNTDLRPSVFLPAWQFMEEYFSDKDYVS